MLTSTTPAAAVQLPLTCGELVQGTYRGTPALVSCPIARYQTAQVWLDERSTWEIPDQRPKTRKAFQLALDRLIECSPGGELRLLADPPLERGYGTSTADIAASLYALGKAAGALFRTDQIAEIALHVEPSDSTIYPGLTLFDHRQGRLQECWGQAPALQVIVLDPGGRVDTLSFNRQDFSGKLKTLAPQHQQAFSLLQEGLQKENLEAIGQAATLSALIHQDILYSPLLEEVHPLLGEMDALGLCRAHSGTLVGILHDPRQRPVNSVVHFLRDRLPSKITIHPYPLTNGGPRWLAETKQSRS